MCVLCLVCLFVCLVVGVWLVVCLCVQRVVVCVCDCLVIWLVGCVFV